jgi:hypothetical protein
MFKNKSFEPNILKCSNHVYTRVYIKILYPHVDTIIKILIVKLLTTTLELKIHLKLMQVKKEVENTLIWTYIYIVYKKE